MQRIVGLVQSARMESTHLDLLTRNGSIAVTFTPPIDQEHYTELNSLVRQCDDERELKSAIIQAAYRWGRSVEID